MIIGFGFGSFYSALIMLLVTSFLSYFLFKFLRGRKQDSYWNEPHDFEEMKNRRRDYYYGQRQKAHEMMDQFDLSDEEIEKRIEEEMRS
ncbi:MAG: hypothetical protein GX434_01375 [Peptococcaceae bacterium]|nr:hypothetical protein [Peptococcaceae bacterium]